jgi:hypothetical protein
MFGAVEEKVSADFPGSAAIKEFPDASEFVYVACGFSARFKRGNESRWARAR